MRGTPARAIQERAGHQALATMQPYMHLNPAAIQAAVRHVEDSSEDRPHGDGEIVEEAGKQRLRKVAEETVGLPTEAR